MVDESAEISWQNCLKLIRDNVSEQSFKTWFEPIVPHKLVDKKLTIQVPSQFFYEWLEDNYVHLLRKALDYSIGREGTLEYSIIVDSGNTTQNQPPIGYQVPNTRKVENAPNTAADEKAFKSPFEVKELPTGHGDSFLNPHYTFDNYIEGDCNRLARAAGFAVAQKPSVTSFNPLMIYGGVGLGKTHLVQAIGNYIKGKLQDRFVLYVSSEKFTNQFINAIRDNSLQDFMNFYMRVDVLILDDVQFLSGKEKTQETFFHIFNHLHQSGKQIVMTSDRPPRQLKGVEDRLLSRFKWGLTADLQTPDYETRIAIIQKKLINEGIHIDYEIIEYLAHSIDSNVRELEGVIVSLIAQASLTRREINMSLAKQTLNHLVNESEKETSVDTIIDAVTTFFDVRVADIKGKGRTRSIVVPRQIAMYIAKELTDLSLKSIGYHFGGRDHSTVIHAIQTVSDMIHADQEMAENIKKIMKSFEH
ncbi:MAG: chromosomal replication initiator protein DnaA [Spirosomataceae bacterium]